MQCTVPRNPRGAVQDAQGSLKDTFCNHLKHGWLFQHQNKVGNHHLQVAMFRCFSGFGSEITCSGMVSKSVYKES